jgi:hypothetical protein
MHPLVLQSITEQRLEELRSGVSGRPNKRGPRRSRSRGKRGPMGRTQARMGVWMIETGSRMVKNGGGATSVGPLSSGMASASA